jgi:hypothetical protein
MVKACLIDMNGLRRKVDLNIIPLGWYDFIIDMNWLDEDHFYTIIYHLITLWESSRG